MNSCLDCHSAQDGPLQVTPEKFSQDIHAQKGLTCVSCHGGDASSYDPDQAMSRKAGWKGKIDRKQIPQLCGSCHSNPAFMRQYNPSLRTDQLDQYHTSMHGKRLAAGRHQGRRLRRLPQRPRSPPAQRSALHRQPRQRGQDLLALPLRRGAT